jgi:hypothetical protein
MIEKTPLCPERVRKIAGSFAFIEHRFLRQGFFLIIPQCSISPKFLKLLKRGHENASQETHANPPLASICA